MDHQINMFKGSPDNEAIKMIQYFEPLALQLDPRGYCVCTSEGKDSRVLGHLYRRAGVKHFYIHNITGIDPPELIYFQRKNFAEYKDLGYLTYDIMYRISMWKLMIKKRTPPLRRIRYCCEELKERRVPEQGNAIISLGVRKHESARRKANRNELEISETKRKNIILPFDNSENRRTFETCYADNEKRLNPIIDWTDTNIWDYSNYWSLEQCNLYSSDRGGFKRLGCIGCPMAGEKGRKKEFEQWPKYKEQYIRTFAKMIETRKAKGLEMFKYGDSAQEWFDWWMSDKGANTDPNQLELELK